MTPIDIPEHDADFRKASDGSGRIGLMRSEWSHHFPDGVDPSGRYFAKGVAGSDPSVPAEPEQPVRRSDATPARTREQAQGHNQRQRRSQGKRAKSKKTGTNPVVAKVKGWNQLVFHTIQDHQLSHVEALTLINLYCHERDGTARVTQELIAREMGTSLRSVQLATQRLRVLGLIEYVEPPRPRQIIIYRVFTKPPQSNQSDGYEKAQ